jgi:hypothetical protein
MESLGALDGVWRISDIAGAINCCAGSLPGGDVKTAVVAWRTATEPAGGNKLCKNRYLIRSRNLQPGNPTRRSIHSRQVHFIPISFVEPAGDLPQTNRGQRVSDSGLTSGSLGPV